MPDEVTVSVHLHTILQRRTADGLLSRLEVRLPTGSTLADLLEILKVELPVEALLLAVNGRTAEVDYVLAGGEQINLMPAISGG